MTKRKSPLNLVRVSLMLPSEMMSWVDMIAEMEGTNRSAVVRDALQQFRLSEALKKKANNSNSRIGGITLSDISSNYKAGTLDKVWMDSLSSDEKLRLIKHLESLA